MHYDRVMIFGFCESDAPRESSEQVTRGVDDYDGKAMVRGSARVRNVVQHAMEKTASSFSTGTISVVQCKREVNSWCTRRTLCAVKLPRNFEIL